MVGDWWQNEYNVHRLARWLAARDWFPTPSAVVDYFESAYKYDHEWRHMEAEGLTPASHPPRQKRCELCEEMNPEPAENEE